MLKSPAFSTSFLESRMIQKLKSRKSRIKSGFFAFLLAERIIFGKKTQKSQVPQMRYLTFFVSGWNVLATRRGCAPRSACRGGLQPCGLRLGPTESAGESESVPFLSRCYGGYPSFSPLFSVVSHPLAPTFIPSSTQNTPGFAFFGLIRVRFLVFCSFGRGKFSIFLLCTLPLNKSH